MRSVKAAAVFMAAVLLSVFMPQIQVFADDDEYYTVTEPLSEENGVLTIDTGSPWYKVNCFENDSRYIICVKGSDGKPVMLTAADRSDKEYVWRYYLRTMVTSTAPRCATLYSNSFYLGCHEDKLYTYSRSWTDGDTAWDYYDGKLRYNEDGTDCYLKYNEGSKEPFSCTFDPAEASEVSIYTNGDKLGRCISRQPAAQSYVIEGSGYKAPSFSVGLSSLDIITDDIKWYVDGTEQSCAKLEFTADVLAGKPAGVHRVNCIVTAHDNNGVHYREKSADAAFVIAKGVLPDSVVSFSDIHEQYGFIPDAIKNVIQRTGGYIPSLVVCTGDLVNGPTVDKDTMLSRYYPQIVSALGGLDAVFVSGNHDSGEAASIMSAAAKLGAEGNISPSGGQIFRGTSSEAASNGRNSRFARGITVYGLNFEVSQNKQDSTYTYSYDKAIKELDSFLRKTAANYNGELVIISAHSGLHVLGVLPQSVSSGGGPIGQWVGENQYNVDKSYEMAKLINSYAEKYNMDIMYLFGHNHSRQERELIMTDGAVLISTESYAERSYGSQKLSFTYAHSGYLSTTIGCADANFSFIYRDGDNYSFDLIRISDDRVRHTDIKAKSRFREPPAVTTSAATTASAANPGTSTASHNSPKTGDSSGFAVIFVSAAAIMLLSRKRKN